MRPSLLAVCLLAAVAACFGVSRDVDDDGVPDQRDNCPTRSNPDQADWLRNGVGDACRCDRVRCGDVGDACKGAATCDPRSGECVRPRSANGTPCDDGDACTRGDACRDGVCASGLAVTCAGASDCADAVCDRALGCVIRSRDVGSPCDDGIANTEVDACDGRGACVGGCAVGRTTCGATCTSLATDPIHCGACGVRCDGGSSCVAGVCACAAGRTRCPSSTGPCTDLATDASNCGRCGGACPPGATCVAGVCTASCSGGATDCGGTCVMLGSDHAHCGACGNACGAAQTCIAGACLTPCSGGVLCGGACVSLSTNIAHCGACGRLCPAPAHAAAACVDGACEIRCDDGYFQVGAVCLQSLPPPRLVAPLSTATVTTRRPTLRWASSVVRGGARVHLCRDRACGSVIETIEATGDSARPARDLPTGVIFWKAYGRVGSAVGTEVSATWQLTVGARSAPVDASWGARLDLNGDGYADLAIGAPRAGRVFVYAGGAGGAAVTPTTTLTRTDGTLGDSIASAGDTNGDGYADLIVGAVTTGRAYVFLGGASGVSSERSSTLVGPDGSQFGVSVAGAGDVNGDGYADVVVGANMADSSVGRAYVYLGAPSGVSTTPSITLASPDGPRGFGFRVAGAGDLNGDGYADVVVAAPFSSSGLGRVYVFAGSASGLAATPTTTLIAPDGGSFGWSVANAGDVNGDGYADLEVGAPYTSTSGTVYVYHGGPSGVAAPSTTLYDPHATHQSFGVAAAGAGDINGDGYADLAVQGYCPDPGGCVALHLGGAAGLAATSSATVVQPEFSNSATGVAGAGDVDADGYDDLLIGASSNIAWVYAGSAGGLVTSAATTLLEPVGPDSGFGFAVAARSRAVSDERALRGMVCVATGAGAGTRRGSHRARRTDRVGGERDAWHGAGAPAPCPPS